MTRVAGPGGEEKVFRLYIERSVGTGDLRIFRMQSWVAL